MSGRFLVTCWPFEGHIFPQMSLATTLRARGHQIAFYTGSTARRLIEPEGIPLGVVDALVERRIDLLEAEQRSSATWRWWGPHRRLGGLRRDRAVSTALTKATELAGCGLRRRVDHIRSAHGLGPLGCSMNAFTVRLPLYLVGNIPSLAHGRGDLPASAHYVGQCLWHPLEEPGTKARLERLPHERPWVHVTAGTSHYRDPFLLKATAAVLAGEPLEAILTTGGRRNPESVVPRPAPNVHALRWLSHGELLPRCAAVVTTGGPATIMAALTAGVPLVVVPTTWDKPDNARHVVGGRRRHPPVWHCVTARSPRAGGRS